MKGLEAGLPRSVLRLVEAVVAAVGETDVTSVELESGAFSLQLRRSPISTPVLVPVVEVTAAEPPAPGPLEPLIVPITSELVGRFLMPQRVQRGDAVAAGDIVACIESMTLMNEVRAPMAGRIVEILVEPGHPVEYGQVLMALVPASPAESGG